jgi:hypothetical protein
MGRIVVLPAPWDPGRYPLVESDASPVSSLWLAAAEAKQSSPNGRILH